MIIRLSQVVRDIFIPKYWRREFYEEPQDTLLATTVVGTLISTSYTVTINESSYIRIMASAWMQAADDVQYWGDLKIYEGATGITLRDNKYATCRAPTTVADRTRNSCAPLYEGLYAAGSYVFEIRGRGSVVNKVTATSTKWCIDVCRA